MTPATPHRDPRLSTVDAAVAGHRRGGQIRGRSWLWSVRTQLIAPIVVATVGLVALGAVQTAAASASAQDAKRAQVLATTATASMRLGHELERELAETAALRQRGGKAGLLLVTAQQQRADEAKTRYLSTSAPAKRAAPALAGVLNSAEAALDGLQTARDKAKAGTAGDQQYDDIASSLLAVADAIPAQLRDPKLATAAREIADVAAVEHFAAVERDLIRAIIIRKSLQPGDLTALSRIDGAREERTAEFVRLATPSSLTLYGDQVTGTDVDKAEAVRTAVLRADREPAGLQTDADGWYVAQSGTIRRINQVGLRLSDQLDRVAAQTARSAVLRAQLTAGGAGGLALLALLSATLLAVRTSRRMRKLREAALTVARHELPDAIAAVAGGSAPHIQSGRSAAEVTRSIAGNNDEVGQLAAAFATVHRTALVLAAEQAELRVDVAKMAEVLARRIRTLVTRQLRMLDDFERDETDPEALERLFVLDHLAARLRRNGESLLVLAGGEPGRPYQGAFPLRAVITAAASEIEHYDRVDAGELDAAVSGGVVGDLVHLLAELLENATNFSPPEKSVRVDARRTLDGLLLRIYDHGIGLTPARLAEINERLARRASLSSAAAGTMGLYVVAHLAARHGIEVQLHPTGAGTAAYVHLPHTALADPGEAVTAGVPSHLQGVRPGGVEATAWFRQAVSSTSGDNMFAAGDLGRAPTRPAVNAPALVRGSAAVASNGHSNGHGQGPPRFATSHPPAPAAPPVRAVVPRPRDGQPDNRNNLPRRQPGNQLAPTVSVQTSPDGDTNLIEPERVRLRLSALSEGVSAGQRRMARAGSVAVPPQQSKER